MKYRYKKKKSSKIKNFFIIVITMTLVIVATLLLHTMYLGIEINPFSAMQTNETATMITRTLEESKVKSKEVADVIEEISSSVVGISKIKDTGNAIFLPNSAENLGLGTGVIITEDGYILTNEHVSGGKYSTCYVTLENGKTYNGNVVWADNSIDLAIVKIGVKSLPYIKLGDSETIRVAEQVFAIGNPIGFEFQRTVTAGIISALNRTLRIETEEGNSTYMEDLIQTDATINPGNSGGPLVNLNGEMIGITSVKITTAEGMGFAVPVNMVKPIIQKLITNKTFEEAYLGISGYDREVLPYLDTKLTFDQGIYVVQIALDGPCHNTDLKIGDVITKIDGITTNRMYQLREYVYKKNPEDLVTLTIMRANKEYTMKVHLGRKP